MDDFSFILANQFVDLLKIDTKITIRIFAMQSNEKKNVEKNQLKLHALQIEMHWIAFFGK